jgi:molybdate/tungstate transport system substrate-binding protein
MIRGEPPYGGSSPIYPMKILPQVTVLLLIISLASCADVRKAPESTTLETPTKSIQAQRIPLVVFGAGSLIVPFDHIEKAFEAHYPNIDVQAEYHGSIQVIRHVSELHELIDVVATADAALIPMLMYAVNDPDSGFPYANWYIRFASNHLAIALSPTSRLAGEITGDNWPAALNTPESKVGIADPRFDAAGYRALMAYALMQELTGNYTLFTDMFNGKFVSPITIFMDDDQTTITVPEVLETKPNVNIMIRGASIQLIALLESGDMDAAFEYESVIQQHGLPMVRLPAEVNLGESGYDDIYNKVVVNMDFRRFATVVPEFRGQRIGYGITIPSNAPHPEEASQFIAFLLSPEGRFIMESDYHPLFEQPLANNYQNVPVILQDFCIPEPTQ